MIETMNFTLYFYKLCLTDYNEFALRIETLKNAVQNNMSRDVTYTDLKT